MRTRFDLDWLAEGDAQSKALADSTLVNSGIADRNEVRRRRGLNTRSDENADALTVQSAMTTIDAIGAQPEAPAPLEQLEPDHAD